MFSHSQPLLLHFNHVILFISWIIDLLQLKKSKRNRSHFICYYIIAENVITTIAIYVLFLFRGELCNCNNYSAYLLREQGFQLLFIKEAVSVCVCNTKKRAILSMSFWHSHIQDSLKLSKIFYHADWRMFWGQNLQGPGHQPLPTLLWADPCYPMDQNIRKTMSISSMK